MIAGKGNKTVYIKLENFTLEQVEKLGTKKLTPVYFQTITYSQSKGNKKHSPM